MIHYFLLKEKTRRASVSQKPYYKGLPEEAGKILILIVLKMLRNTYPL